MLEKNKTQADKNWENIEEMAINTNPYNINITRYDTDLCQIVWTPPNEIIFEGTTNRALNMLKAIKEIEKGE